MRHTTTPYATCKCDVCLEEKNFSYDEDTHNYDSESGMVVCKCCFSDFEASAKVYETPVKWEPVPETKLDYDVREYEPDDYTND